VLHVVDGSPAQAAGLAEGDLLLAANGRPVETLDDLLRVLVLSPDADIALDVSRGGSRRSFALRPLRARAAA
jgi:S1-C subfamily serine protease